jgi:hypothetical protein
MQTDTSLQRLRLETPRSRRPSRRSGRRSAIAKAANDSAAIPSWAAAKPSVAVRRLVAQRAASAAPTAIPVRKLASIVAKATTLTPTMCDKRRVHRTS